jgi:hypothetical protein
VYSSCTVPDLNVLMVAHIHKVYSVEPAATSEAAMEKECVQRGAGVEPAGRIVAVRSELQKATMARPVLPSPASDDDTDESGRIIGKPSSVAAIPAVVQLDQGPVPGDLLVRRIPTLEGGGR